MRNVSFARDMLKRTYRKLAIVPAIALVLLVGIGCSGSSEQIILATTTSTNDSGLLDVLVPEFEDQYDYNVKIIAVGSGQAIEMGQRGDADVLLAHAPSSEEQFVADGYGVNRQLVMHNDFIIVGPADDPAGVAHTDDALDALQAIADHEAAFFSRGDDSGTHKLELKLWEELGMTPTPDSDSWYEETGSGMGPTLQTTNQREGYTISDRATYLAQQENLDLAILSEGDAVLLNIYHVMQVNPDRFDDVNAEGGAAFVAFMVADATQQLIGEFGVEEFGQQLFVPDAGKSEDELAP
jgi:tungstate transport system substrate-binding protein